MMNNDETRWLSWILFGIAATVDDERATKISLKEMRSWMQGRTVFDELKDRGLGPDMTFFDSNEKIEFLNWYVDQLCDNAYAMEGDEKKYAVLTSGIALLIAYTAEALQSRR